MRQQTKAMLRNEAQFVSINTFDVCKRTKRSTWTVTCHRDIITFRRLVDLIFKMEHDMTMISHWYLLQDEIVVRYVYDNIYSYRPFHNCTDRSIHRSVWHEDMASICRTTWASRCHDMTRKASSSTCIWISTDYDVDRADYDTEDKHSLVGKVLADVYIVLFCNSQEHNANLKYVLMIMMMIDHLTRVEFQSFRSCTSTNTTVNRCVRRWIRQQEIIFIVEIIDCHCFDSCYNVFALTAPFRIIVQRTFIFQTNTQSC
jgi:hypothetical protein